MRWMSMRLVRFSLALGVAALVMGNLVWRIMCEGAILLFSLHELLVSIDTRTGLLVRQGKRIEP